MLNALWNDREWSTVGSRKSEFDGVYDEAPLALSSEHEALVWRKVDLRLLPVWSAMYFFAFMDRGNIANAALNGLTTQLNLSGNQYNTALTMFFVSYCIFQCPANLVYSVCRPSRWLSSIMVLWGIVMMLMAFVKTYPQLVAVRLCLGVSEAGLLPGIVFYLTSWYPRHMLQYRIGLFFGVATLAGAFSGLIGFGISHMDGVGNLEGWSWIFIIEGALTVVVGFIAFFLIIDSPWQATFLNSSERAFIIWRKKYDNSTVGEGECFPPRHIIAAFSDWQLYLHLLVYLSSITPLYGITFFLPSIISSFGYSTPVSQLLTVPPYLIASIVLVAWSYYSDKLKTRSLFIYAGYILLIIGYSINLSNVSNGAKYFGTYFLVIGSFGSYPGVISWLGNNLAGRYKRAVGMALHIGFGNVGAIIAANIYRKQSEPRFAFGHSLELMFVGIGMVTVPVLVLLYKRINQSRDEALRQRLARRELHLSMTIQQLRDLGDRAPDFRYTL